MAQLSQLRVKQTASRLLGHHTLSSMVPWPIAHMVEVHSRVNSGFLVSIVNAIARMEEVLFRDSPEKAAVDMFCCLLSDHIRCNFVATADGEEEDSRVGVVQGPGDSAKFTFSPVDDFNYLSGLETIGWAPESSCVPRRQTHQPIRLALHQKPGAIGKLLIFWA
ncbi:hypothetical protein LIA77_00883 [Sarocladium implicatum]|nr:hypothetical protein LIA77_00883 [Sarocladium implicatum]